MEIVDLYLQLDVTASANKEGSVDVSAGRAADQNNVLLRVGNRGFNVAVALTPADARLLASVLTLHADKIAPTPPEVTP